MYVFLCIMIPWMLYMNFNEFPVSWFVLGCISCSCKSSLIPGMLYSWVLIVNFTANSLNVHSLFYYNYSYCKFVDILFKRLKFLFIEFSLYIGFIVLEIRS